MHEFGCVNSKSREYIPLRCAYLKCAKSKSARITRCANLNDLKVGNITFKCGGGGVNVMVRMMMYDQSYPAFNDLSKK